MASSHTTGLAIFLMVVAAAATAQETCVIPHDDDWESRITPVRSKLPDSLELPVNASVYQELLDNFVDFLPGNMTLSGLSSFHRDGGLRTYCEYGKPRLDAGFLSRVPLQLDVPFQYCSGSSGTVGTQVDAVKLIITFDIEEDNGKNTLRPSEVSPLWLQAVDFHIYGLGDFMSQIAHYAGKVFTPFIKDYWITILALSLREMFQEIYK